MPDTEMALRLILKSRNSTKRMTVTSPEIIDAKDAVEIISPGISDICEDRDNNSEASGDNIAPTGMKSPTTSIMLPRYIMISQMIENMIVASGEIQDT